VKIGNKFNGLPLYSKTYVLDKIGEVGDSRYKSVVERFEPIEVNILEYLESKGSNIAPHFDDFWIWGERIIGMNLLSDTVLTFTNPKDSSFQIDLPIPRRSMYLMSGSSRFQF